MIFTPRLPCPNLLNTTNANQWATELCQARSDHWQHVREFQAGTRTDKPGKPPTAKKTRYAHPEVKAQLQAMFGDKCAYCECEAEPASAQNVEHFRPASIYPALAYRWENLLFACSRCNSAYKRAQFPLAPAGDTPQEDKNAPCSQTGVGETPLLVNPCEDNPETHLTFRDGRVVERTERGRITWQVCGLNRDRLLTSRLEWLKSTRELILWYQIADMEGKDIQKAQFNATLRRRAQATAKYAAMVRTELANEGIDWQTL